MILPGREQTWLLRACLLSGRDEAAAWENWRRHVNIDDIEAASYRLMPLLHQNLRREKVEDELLGRLKGIHRHTWSRNQLLFHAAAQLMGKLEDAGIPVLVLKGAALANGHYADPGLRPMNDFDFMVRFADVPRAFELMQQCGWAYAETIPLAQLIWCTHAGKWANGQGQQIDLHWHLLPEGRQPDVDDAVWQRAVNIKIGGRTFKAMSPADLLWHVCAHGGIGDAIMPIRWVADAWTILRNNPLIDWEVLIAEAKRRHLTLGTHTALEYLHREFGAPVPSYVLQTLAAAPVTWMERWAQRINSEPHGVAGILPLHLINYLRLMRDRSLVAKISGVPLFFRRTWGLHSAWHLPGCFVNKTLRRLREVTAR